MNEVGSFVVVQRGEDICERRVSRISAWKDVVAIVFRIVDGVVMAPLDHETPFLDQGLFIFYTKSMNACNGGVGHRESRPLMSRNASACGEGHEKIVSLCVPGRSQDDGTERSRASSVGRRIIFEDLDVCAEFEFHVIVVGRSGAGDDSRRAKVA